MDEGNDEGTDDVLPRLEREWNMSLTLLTTDPIPDDVLRGRLDIGLDASNSLDGPVDSIGDVQMLPRTKPLDGVGYPPGYLTSDGPSGMM